MKRVVLSFVTLACSAVALTAMRRTPRLAEAAEAPETAPLPSRHIGIASGTIARAVAAVVTPASAPSRDEVLASRRRRVKASQAGTYIGEILAERDSSIARWPDRGGVPLTVWIQPQSRVMDFDQSYVARVRDAFQAWDALHLPLHFAFVDDSAKAEVHVTWIDRFSQPISGRTRWSRDDDWQITDANIVLAVHHTGGEQLDSDSMHAMALHEIGHLLGLDHTTDEMSIMAPRVRVRALSEADRATVRLIYATPSGPLR